MPTKRVLIPERMRKVPREFGFGWIDRRFLHEGYVHRCDPPAFALYLLLTVVADAQGLSFYADATLARLLSLPVGEIACARATLIRAGLMPIKHRSPRFSRSIRLFKNHSSIITSNRSVDDWGKLLGDVVIVAPLLGRLYHHGHMLRFEGKSWRLHQAALRHAAGGHPRVESDRPAPSQGGSVLVSASGSI